MGPGCLSLQEMHSSLEYLAMRAKYSIWYKVGDRVQIRWKWKVENGTYGTIKDVRAKEFRQYLVTPDLGDPIWVFPFQVYSPLTRYDRLDVL